MTTVLPPDKDGHYVAIVHPKMVKDLKLHPPHRKLTRKQALVLLLLSDVVRIDKFIKGVGVVAIWVIPDGDNPPIDVTSSVRTLKKHGVITGGWKGKSLTLKRAKSYSNDLRAEQSKLRRGRAHGVASSAAGTCANSCYGPVPHREHSEEG